MKTFKCLFTLFSICLFFTACEQEEKKVDAPPPPPAAVLPVEFINPYPIPLEVRIFDHTGWVEKLQVPPHEQVIREVPEGLYSIGVKDTTSGQYLHFFPSGYPSDTLLDQENFGIKVNPQGERDLRYRFRRTFLPDSLPTRLVVDMSFDSSRTYALANARWVYISDDAGETTATQQLAQMEAEGDSFIMGVYTARTPFTVPLETRSLGQNLPGSIDLENKSIQKVPKLYQIPDSISTDSIRDFVMGEVFFYALLLQASPPP